MTGRSRQLFKGDGAPESKAAKNSNGEDGLLTLKCCVGLLRSSTLVPIGHKLPPIGIPPFAELQDRERARTKSGRCSDR